MPRTASTGGRRDLRPLPPKRFCSACASIAAILHATPGTRAGRPDAGPLLGSAPVPALLASIPSPADPFVFQLGRFDVRWYGLLLAIGVLMAGWIAQHEF